MAERLLLLWDRKHVGFDGWDGFMFSRDVLRWKNRQRTPQMLKNWHEQNETIRECKRV